MITIVIVEDDNEYPSAIQGIFWEDGDTAGESFQIREFTRWRRGF